MKPEHIIEALPVAKFLESELGQRLFPSRASFDWFVRINREAVADYEAVTKLGGRVMVVPSLLCEVMAASARAI